MATSPTTREPHPPETGRALVAMAPTGLQCPGIAHVRADAAFIAQLIAAASRAPQTRRVRRGSPEQAASSYRCTVTRQQADRPLAGAHTSRTV